MKNTSLFNSETIQSVQAIRKTFLKVAVWILIIELAFLAILILAGGWSAVIGRLQLTFLTIATVLFIGVNNFIRIEKGDKAIQAFAVGSFISCLISCVLMNLLIWEILPFNSLSRYHVGLSFWANAMCFFLVFASSCFWISNVMSIKETINSVKPLKITAISCVSYLWAYETFLIIAKPNIFDEVFGKFSALSGLAGFAFIITALAAIIVSRSNSSKSAQRSTTQSTEKKTDAELRAEIEEKIRREMLEKEIREKLQNEKSE